MRELRDLGRHGLAALSRGGPLADMESPFRVAFSGLCVYLGAPAGKYLALAGNWRTRKRFQTMERTLYSNMFRQPAGRDSRDGEKEAIVPYHTREHLVKKLREMKEDPQMLELVLPECLGEEEVACAGEVARELGLKTEKSPQCGLRVFKPGVQPEDFEQYLH